MLFHRQGITLLLQVFVGTPITIFIFPIAVFDLRSHRWETPAIAILARTTLNRLLVVKGIPIQIIVHTHPIARRALTQGAPLGAQTTGLHTRQITVFIRLTIAIVVRVIAALVYGRHSPHTGPNATFTDIYPAKTFPFVRHIPIGISVVTALAKVQAHRRVIFGRSTRHRRPIVL
jgi:hypothetical protein